MNGFSQKMTDVSHILVYVKLNKANTITLNAEMLDDYYKSTGIPNLVLKSGAPYEVMARGAQKWSTAQTVTAGNSYATPGRPIFYAPWNSHRICSGNPFFVSFPMLTESRCLLDSIGGNIASTVCEIRSIRSKGSRSLIPVAQP